MTSSPSSTRRKIVSLEAFLPLRKALAAEGRRLVFTNGCFDLLHAGHIDYLERARLLGDRLMVAINTDDGVRRLKGNSRPIFPQEERAEILAAFEFVDFVTVFAQETPREIIVAVRPDVLVKGSDWALNEIVGREEVEAFGGRVVALDFLPGHSTTGIIETIVRNYGKRK